MKDRRRQYRPHADIRYALMMFVALIASFAAWQALTLASRVSRDENRTCAIQQRGLPAGHELASAMQDIHSLLTQPPSPDSPPVPPNIERIVTSLNRHLALYLAAESAQPSGRAC